MFFTDDPAADYDRYCAEQERQLAKYPVCTCCETAITDDWYFEIGNEILCEECMHESYRRSVEIFVEGWEEED